MDLHAFAALLERQQHVFTRHQVQALGADENLIRRMIRRREWSIVHPGVMVDHTGEPTRLQLEWAAVLYYAPAALTGRPALLRHGVRTGREGAGAEPAIHVAVDRGRRVAPVPGIRVTRMADFDLRALANLSPPRVRLEHVVLDLAAGADDDTDAIAVLVDACRSRRTTATRLLTTLEERPRLRRRRLIKRVLIDVSEGTNSVLEWLYLNRVERPHSLPTARRQRRITQRGASGYRDVDAAVDGMITVRLGWRQVAEPCRTADAMARILMARGWSGTRSACSPACR